MNNSENRLITFPTKLSHRGVSQTDKQFKILINFKYIKRNDVQLFLNYLEFIINKDSKNFSKPINARIETVLEKPIFQNSVLNHRCLIPADGYFEWQRIENQKYPHFHYLTNREDFAMAGIWNKQTSIKKIEKSFAILTKQAESNISHIHNRMPVILSSKDWEEWLSPTVKIHQLLSRYSQNTQTLEFHQVSSRINGVNIDGVELLEKFSEKQSTLW